MAAFYHSISDPWIAVAGWNASPAKLLATHWPDKLQDALVLLDVDITCDQGERGGIYGYALAREAFENAKLIKSALRIPWKAHC